ncbi:Fpg/Nei family DNA glycosylase [Corynebacterium tapiri]|uniref:DNA-(apurinic or apyrimidinic site) lyase n=1 Tax=Corynebacterium tapiri TaxID=1448266 RepID=A0A5C4U1J0_9CORY|nr:DNA-formamidopyrimidine glycosylase family protein [Corynebacterium tapiri]TNL95348.1 Fpg/Nei family DNA glycosylase [Corynebacterium tapiri]
MPEGHVIHRLARDFNDRFSGDPVQVSSPQGRFSAEARHLSGHQLLRAEARGKHLFLFFDEKIGPENIVYIHLGLIGSLRFEPIEDVWGQIRLRIIDAAETQAANLRGPQFCRLIDAAEFRSITARLGEDPLLLDAPPIQLFEKLTRSRRRVAALLMDQKLFAGVGNVYRAEVLFRQGIDPQTPGNQLSQEQFRAIWEDLVYLMHIGVERGRIDTVRDEHLDQALQVERHGQQHGGDVYVYRRAGEACFVCGEQVRTTVLEARNLFWCPACQG